MNRTLTLAFGLLVGLGAATSTLAQEAATEPVAAADARWTHNFGFTGAFGLQEPTRVSSLDYSALYCINDKKSIQVGPGLRGFVYTGEFVWYPTVNSGNVGNADGDPGVDQLLVLSPSISGINVTLNAKYETKRFVAGLSVDLAGLGFGGDEGGRFYAADTTGGTAIADSRNVAEGSTNAPSTNLFMSQGALMNEFWIGYRLRPSITLRSGINLFNTEYEVPGDQLPADATETRYEHMAALIFFGLNLRIN